MVGYVYHQQHGLEAAGRYWWDRPGRAPRCAKSWRFCPGVSGMDIDMHAVCYKSRQISSNFTLHHSKLCSWEVSTLVTCFSFVFDVRRYVRISLPRRKQWWMTLWKSSKPCEAIVEEGNSKLAVSLMDNVWAPSCYGWKQSVVWKFCLEKEHHNITRRGISI